MGADLHHRNGRENGQQAPFTAQPSVRREHGRHHEQDDQDRFGVAAADDVPAR